MTERPPITRVRPAALVRTGDALTVALLLLAGSVALSGGFRVWVGGWRVSVTSPERLLLAALLLTSLRHWFVRRPTLPARLWHGAVRLLGSEALRAVWPVAIAGRAGVAAVGLLAVFLVGYPIGEPRFRVSRNELDQSAGAVGRGVVSRHRAGRVPMAPEEPRAAEHRVLPRVPDADARGRPAARREDAAGGARGRAHLVRRLSRRVDVSVQAGARAPRARLERTGGRGGAAARQLPVRRVLRRVVHRGAVPLRHRGRLLAHAAAAALAGRRVGAAGGAHPPERGIPERPARPARRHGCLPARSRHRVARAPRRARAAGVGRSGHRCAAVLGVHLSDHRQPLRVGCHSGPVGTHVRRCVAVAREDRSATWRSTGCRSTCASRRRTS